MYDIIFSNKAIKQLKKLERHIQERILLTLERVRIRPESHLIKLVGDFGYKLRIGDYRLFLDVDKGNLVILVLKVGHRKSVYKQS
jgi:mRNA interferase RelE/StbE